MTRFTPSGTSYLCSVPASRGQLGGLKKILRKVGPIAAGAAAVAAGQPQLAVAAGSAVSSATKKKKKAPELVEAPLPAPALLPADRNVLLIGGSVLATLLVSRLLLRK